MAALAAGFIRYQFLLLRWSWNSAFTGHVGASILIRYHLDGHEEGSGTIQFLQGSAEDIEEVSFRLVPHSLYHAPGVSLLEPPRSNLLAFVLHDTFPMSIVLLPNSVIRSMLMRDHILQVLVSFPRVPRAHRGHDYRQHTACSLSMAAHWKRMGCHSSTCVSLFLSWMLVLLTCFASQDCLCLSHIVPCEHSSILSIASRPTVSVRMFA